ncbi:MAG: hypothetical protein KDB66_04915 [Solirubrobacterales bacterium]|nr:hypothetical protein [Solirubrobacterales bacterium]MCB8915511.1 hypothetical protein [Thermoleophilales bacterium]
MVTETEGALPPARRRRRRPRKVLHDDTPVTVSVSVVTVIRADQPFADDREAEAWLDRLEDSGFTGDLLEDAIAAFDRARAAHAVAAGVPFGVPTRLESVLAARIGYGEGEQVASGRYQQAADVDARGGTAENRRERMARTGSLARTAAILGGRETAAACEVLLPRIRLDLETGNEAAARLSIASAIGATIGELEFALEDQDHERDLDRLEEMLPRLEEISRRAEQGSSEAADAEYAEEALEVAERVIRRRRILEQ